MVRGRHEAPTPSKSKRTHVTQQAYRQNFLKRSFNAQRGKMFHWCASGATYSNSYLDQFAVLRHPTPTLLSQFKSPLCGASLHQARANATPMGCAIHVRIPRQHHAARGRGPATCTKSRLSSCGLSTTSLTASYKLRAIWVCSGRDCCVIRFLYFVRFDI